VFYNAVFLGIALFVLLAGTAAPASAQFRDVAYTFEPTVQGVFNADNASFQEEPLYGGLLGLGFGRYFQVGAEYLVNTNVRTDLTNVGRLGGLPNRDLDVRRYGARMRVNLYDRRIIPYLTVGSGVLRLEPEAREATRTIYGLAGGGIAFTLQDWFRMSVSGELLSYRYDPVATYLGPAGASGSTLGTQLVTQPAVTTSISLFLGGRSPDEQTAVDQALQQQFGGRGALGGVRLFVNPFYGRVEFNDALGFPKDQNLAGVTAGVDLGPYIGLRGFYWRGTEGNTVTEDFGGGFEDIQMYGSELQFRLNLGLGQGFVPYARLGGGYMDVLSGYADDIPEGTTPPEDGFFGIGGGGLEVPISRSFKLSGGVRGLLMDNPNQEEAGDPGDLYGSLMYTAGIEFRLGGGRDEPEPPQPQPMPQPQAEAQEQPAEEPTVAEAAEEPGAQQPQAEESAVQPTPPAAEGEAPTERQLSPFEEQLLARLDSLESSLQSLQQRQAAADTAAQRAAAQAPAPEQPAKPQSNVSDRTMTIPVPEEGEVYLRFGEGTAPVTVQGDTATAARPQPSATGETVTPAEVEQRLQQALRQQLAERAQSDTAEALRRADLERIIQQALRDVRQQQPQQPQQPGVRLQPTPQPTGAEAQQIRRLEEEIEELRRELREQRADMERDEPVTPVADPEPTTVTTTQPPFYSQILGRPLTYIVPISGFRVGEGPNQFQIGIRGDYRLTTQSKFHLVPELSFGIGQGELSPTVLFSAAYSFLRNTTPQLTTLPLEPYVGFGVGIASSGGFTFEPVTNTMIGFDYQFRTGQTAFLEYSALDFFNTHRIHLGYRVRF